MTALNLKKLAEPFPPDEIEWRVGSTTSNKDRGLALAYLTARHVMDRLDEVCGPEGWQVSYQETPKGRIIATIGIKVSSDWVFKSDGAGETDVEGEKGAISDALKRAAVPWGIGRYLYTLESPWVEIEPMGRSFKIKESEKEKLIRILKRQTGSPEPKQEPSTPKPKETKYPLQEGERRQLWERMMNDLKGEAPKGADAMVRYMQSKETQEDLAKLEPWRQNFRKEAAELVEATRAAEGIAGEKGATIKRIKDPDFSQMAPNDVDHLEELIGPNNG